MVWMEEYGQGQATTEDVSEQEVSLRNRGTSHGEEVSVTGRSIIEK